MGLSNSRQNKGLPMTAQPFKIPNSPLTAVPLTEWGVEADYPSGCWAVRQETDLAKWTVNGW